MEDRLNLEKPKRTYTISQIFREAFPQYMVIGMSPEEYWDGDPWLARAYRKAYKIRVESEEKTADRNAWRVGEYIRRALVSVPITVNGWAPKGHRLQEYPDKPMTMIAEEQKREANRKKQEENKQEMAQALFHVFTERMNKNIRKRLEREKEQAT